jgi:hypothetical protein
MDHRVRVATKCRAGGMKLRDRLQRSTVYHARSVMHLCVTYRLTEGWFPEPMHRISVTRVGF